MPYPAPRPTRQPPSAGRLATARPAARRRIRPAVRGRPLRLLAAALAALALSACGSGGGDAPAAATEPKAPSADYLVSYLYDWYYWVDRLPPAPAPDSYADAHEALAALRVDQDRYSYIEAAASYDAFFDEGRSLGFGITYQVEADALALRLVQPRSPAHAAGMRRGDRIIAIDGQPVAELIAAGTLDEAFGPTEVGAGLEFDIRREGRVLRIAATRDWYQLDYVMGSPGVHAAGERKVGYVGFYSFGRLGVAAWQAALDRLLAEGAQDLVVDLRENGGGLVAIAAQVGSALGLEDLAGRTMGRLEFNPAHASSNRSFSFISDPRAGRFERIVWLTGRRTCSAAEILLTGLDAWRPSTRIGSSTCGKPVGFTPPSHEGWVFSIVSFTTRNALGEGDYYNGLAPDCAFEDPVAGEFGAADEPLLAAALEWLANGRCPAPTAAKALPGAPRFDDSLRGLARLTGLR